MEKAELLLALSEGLKAALLQETRTAGINNLRDEVAPDQTIKGLLVDLQMEIDQIDIGHDTDRTPTVAIPLKAVLALALSIIPPSYKKVLLASLRDVSKAALGMTQKERDKVIKDSALLQVLQDLEDEVLRTLPRSKVRKSVKVKGATLHIRSAGIRREL